MWGLTRIAIIGGGAAGLMAACIAKKPYTEVRVYEMDARVGRRILVTGNGRCNFSNAHVSAEVYHNAEFVRDFYARNRPDTLSMFETLGLVWHEEPDGRLLPMTGKASTVVDVLRACLAAEGVEECCDSRVVELLPPAKEGAPWTLKLAGGKFERAEKVIVCTGGQDALSFLPPGVAVAPFSPVLGPLKTDTTFIRGLDNIRVKCAVSLERAGELLARETGELLFRKYGVSGICVFNLSRFAQPGDMLHIDLLPAVTFEALGEKLSERLERLLAFEPGAPIKDLFRGMFLPQVSEALCFAASIGANERADTLGEAELLAFASIIKSFVLRVEGIAEPAQCQVHRGGVLVSEVGNDLQHKRYPGLYFAGEALDVDGPCGGYNLHWAWTSGMLAGICVAYTEE